MASATGIPVGSGASLEMQDQTTASCTTVADGETGSCIGFSASSRDGIDDGQQVGVPVVGQRRDVVWLDRRARRRGQLVPEGPGGTGLGARPVQPIPGRQHRTE